MRRVIAYHGWASQQWQDRVSESATHSPDYREGANAYAHRQSAIRASMREFCERSWFFVPDWVNLGDSSTEAIS